MQPAGPVRVGEVDVVGYTWQTLPDPLPPQVRLIGTRRVSGSLVARFALEPPWLLTPAEIGARAVRLLGPGPAGPATLVQAARASG